MKFSASDWDFLGTFLLQKIVGMGNRVLWVRAIQLISGKFCSLTVNGVKPATTQQTSQASVQLQWVVGT